MRRGEYERLHGWPSIIQCDDYDFRTKWRFHQTVLSLRRRVPCVGPTAWKRSHVQITMKQVPVPDKGLPSGQQKLGKRRVTPHGYIQAIGWHRIDVRDEYEIKEKESGKVIRRWKENESYKAYTCKRRVVRSRVLMALLGLSGKKEGGPGS